MRYLSVMILALSFVVPCQASSAAGEEAKVMEVTQHACEAFRLRDVARLEKLLATEFVLVDSQGVVQSRAQNIEEVRQGDPAYDIFHNMDMSARVYGSAAVVQGVTHVKGKSGGKTFEIKLRFTDTLVKRDGRWQLVVSHVSRLN